MDLKRKIIIGIVLIVIISTICILIVNNTGVSKPNDDEVIIDNKPINSTVDLDEIFNELEKLDGVGNLENIENPENNEEFYSGEVNDEEVNNEETNQKDIPDEEQIDFGKYNVLEKKAVVKTTDEEVNEVWMVKLGDIKQQEDVCRIFGNRVHKLREAFKEDAVQTQILNEVVIKQEDGIVIMIISPNKMTIEKTIGNMMK